MHGGGLAKKSSKEQEKGNEEEEVEISSFLSCVLHGRFRAKQTEGLVVV